MDDFGDLLFDAGESSLAKHECELCECGNFYSRFYFVDRVAMGRFADSKTGVGERVVFLLVSSDVNVTIVEVVVGEVPVAFPVISKLTNYTILDRSFPTFCQSRVHESEFVGSDAWAGWSWARKTEY